MSTNEDILLAEACSKGIRSGQQFLYRKYAKVLYAILFRYLLNQDDSKDLLHDCFIKIFDKIHLYNGQGSLEGWVKRLTVNECISYLRSKKKMKFSDISEMNIPECDTNEEPIGLSESENFTKEDVQHCLQLLPEEYRIVFQLFALDGYSHKEIGLQLNISENTSRTRYFRSKNMVKEQLMAIASKVHGGIE